MLRRYTIYIFCLSGAALAFTSLQPAKRLTCVYSDLSSGGGYTQHRDVTIIGAGLAGLSVALYLAQLDPSRHITIYDKPLNTNGEKTMVASLAAAGMLAPNAERLPSGDLLDLCRTSRNMYDDFVQMVENLAKQQHARNTDISSSNDMMPWQTGYACSGGFLAPAFAGDSVATWAPPQENDSSSAQPQWLDAVQVREMEPSLNSDIIGGWWFPSDARIDARRLTRALKDACTTSGVQFVSDTVKSLQLQGDHCKGFTLSSGQQIKSNVIVVANGAWMSQLLPVPIQAHKGQSLSLRVPKQQFDTAQPILKRVLFAQDSYIVPQSDGRIIIGATVEAGSYNNHVTPAGMIHILSYALQLVPSLRDVPIEETWAGLRPVTPDKGPLLGVVSPWKNVIVAGGYWRNGVLLAPRTGQLLAKLICNDCKVENMNEKDAQVLKTFAWDRFTRSDRSAKMTADARYAASVHPVQQRSTGMGVSAAVGTELGTYSSARSAREERKRERDSILSDDNDLDAAFEKAAAVGKSEASIYAFGPQRTVTNGSSAALDAEAEKLAQEPMLPPPEKVEKQEQVASTDGKQTKVAKTTPIPSNISDIYKAISANKKASGATMTKNESAAASEKKDPGFRIYFVDSNGNDIEVPPYTTPESFISSLNLKANSTKAEPVVDNVNAIASSSEAEIMPATESTAAYSEKTFDGYQEILSKNSRINREEELALMRESRQRNRLGQQSIDMSKIGAQRMDE